MKTNAFCPNLRRKFLIVLLAAMAVAPCCVPGASRAGTDDFTAELSHERLFIQPLAWVGPAAPSEAESQELLDAFGSGKKISEATGSLESFIKNHPDSPWTPSLRSKLAGYYCQNGYFTLALENWQTAWEAARQGTGRKDQLVADDALVHWLQLLASLGRTETMQALFDETKGRKILPEFQSLYQRTHAAYSIMLKHPDISYRCGTYALSAVAGALGATNYFHQIWEQPSPQTGFSMAKLVELSDANHLNMVAVERTGGEELVVPSVVHWKQNHYAAIVGRQGNLYKVVDPTFQMTRWLNADAINAECSGQFLVPASQVPAGWRNLGVTETSQIFGKGFPDWWETIPCCPSGLCPGCGPGQGGSGGSGGLGGNGGGHGPSACISGCGNGSSLGDGGTSNPGMPDWTVTEPGCDLWFRDEPLSYQPAKGPKISFKLFNSEEVANNVLGSVSDIINMGAAGEMFTFGGNWYPSWLSFVVPDNTEAQYIANAYLLAPGGGARDYTNFDGTMPELATNTRLTVETNSGGTITGFRLLNPSGAVDVYEENYGSAYFLSQQIDERGNATTFVYQTNSAVILLQYVIDGDGRTNTLAYTNVTVNYDTGNETYSNYVSRITDPYGRVVNFNYPGTGGSVADGSQYVGLSNIVDVVGISSSFGYGDSLGTVTQLTTPYGSTTFFGQNWVWGSNCKLTLVTEPNGSHQMFLYAGDAISDISGNYLTAIPAVYTNTLYVPTIRPADNPLGGNTLDNQDWYTGQPDHMQFGNSLYWGRQQFANLSSAFLATSNNWDLSTLTVSDFALPRLRHWDETTTSGQANTLSMERDPSPDGTTTGEMTWYDYPGKPYYDLEGSSDTPTLKIRVLPDGSESYELNQLDQWNNRTNVISTWSAGGQTLLRTNTYVYATNGVDLLLSIGPDGVTNAAYSYDNNHQVLSMTNALGEVTKYLYNAYEQPVSITQPDGLVTTNIYGSNGYLAQQIVVGFSTNSYTYTNGLVYTHTDERGLTTTNTWDALNRLTGVAYPDGTSVSYVYSNLDQVKVVDRMGFTTSFGYNAIRQKVEETNALGRVTSYDYCQCGALESVIDALTNVTTFSHDNQGNVTQTAYPDGYTVNNTYNLLHQLVARTDSGGMSVSNYFNNQGLLVASTNNAGRVQSLSYNINDQVINSVDANSVGVNMAYDNLHRLLTRSYPDGGVEQYGYTPDFPGPTGYTNQIGNVTLYAYDAMNRKTNEVTVGVTTNRFAYNGAGDLLALTDGKNDTTTWGYDLFGRVTNKVDAASNLIFVYQYDPDNRLTNRWSAAKGSTAYSYDAVGNLTHVAYPVSPAVTLNYDVLNRLTNMVDAVGTTVYGYDAASQLLSEDGPWTNDTVSYTYTNRLRTGLSLLQPGASAWTNGYSYDPARRLTGVVSPAGTSGYTYDPVQLQRVDKLTLPNGAYIADNYDAVARLTGTYLINSTNGALDSYVYGYNQANQRTSVVRLSGDSVNYTYDNLGELKTAIGKESNGVTPRLQEQFGYAYDAAGNLNLRTNNALVQTFNVNTLNELTTVTNSGTLTVAGTTTLPATNVTVNGSTASLYADATFALGGLTFTNGNNTFTAVGRDAMGDIGTNILTVNLPGTNNYSFDLNGNLLGDGTRSFAYDDENELISVWVTNVWRSDFVYDGKMRRRIDREYSWNAGTSSWQQTNEIHFVYDGNVVIQERNSNNVVQVTYTRGIDLSGTLQGAGGIGGMLARTDTNSSTFYHADGNGNVTCLITTNQNIAAKYEYDPYGNILSQSGTLASANTYRFSSKEWNANAGLYYYLYRFYDPILQRWPNRDPNGELGFHTLQIVIESASISLMEPNYLANSDPLEEWMFNQKRHLLSSSIRTFHSFGEITGSPDLYEFVQNSPVYRIDFYGLLDTISGPPTQEIIAAARRIVNACKQCPAEEPDFLDCFTYIGWVLGQSTADIANNVDTCQHCFGKIKTSPVPPIPPSIPIF